MKTMKLISHEIYRFLLLCLIAIGIETQAYAQIQENVTIGNLHYNLDSSILEAEVTSPGRNMDYGSQKHEDTQKEYVKGHIDIPSEVRYAGKLYKVTKIGENAFCFCSNLTSVAIPNSVTKIEFFAFAACSNLTNVAIPNSVTQIGRGAFYKTGLRSITIPPNIEVLYGTTGRGRWHCGVFESCEDLEEVIFPFTKIRIAGNAFYNCPKISKLKGLWEGIVFDDGWILPDSERYKKWNSDSIKSSFDYRTNSYVIKKVKEWQKKRDFETTAQYQARVTKGNQEKKTKEFLQEAIKEWTKDHPLIVTLGDYDADYGLYELNSNYGKKYIKIPLASAPSFKNNFSRATFNASYIVTEEGLTVNDLTVRLLGKVYHAEKMATELAETTLDINLPEVNIPIGTKPQGNVAQQTPTKPTPIDRSIDQHIPTGTGQNAKTFAVIIGNERYTQVAQVPYAQNDAKVFAEYCKRTLGLPEKNVRKYDNATFGTMLAAVNDVRSIVEAYNGDCNVIFYYAGHGVPNETSHDAFLLPVDADGRQTEACYPVSRLYRELGTMGARNVVVFMDACFSGAQRGEGMLASARGVALKAKADTPQGNMVVFSAATGDETAFPYKEKGHGMFTYFLLKKLQETKGDVTLGELGEYIQTNVRQQSVVENRKSQTPTVVPSNAMGETWTILKLR